MRNLVLFALALAACPVTAQQSDKEFTGPVQSLVIKKSNSRKPGRKSYEATFDADGKVIAETTYFYRSNTLYYKVMQIFDDKGRSVGERHVDAEGATVKTVKKVNDKDGNKLEQIHLDTDGKELSKMVWTYEKGHIAEAKSWRRGLLMRRHVYTHHKNGKLKTLKFFRAGKLKTITSYNERGAPVKSTTYARDGTVVETQSYSYDDKHRLTAAQSFNAAGAPTQRRVPTYGDRGVIVKMVVTGAAGRLTWNWTYEYDTHGNWIKESELHQWTDGGQATVKTRTITYRK